MKEDVLLEEIESPKKKPEAGEAKPAERTSAKTQETAQEADTTRSYYLQRNRNLHVRVSNSKDVVDGRYSIQFKNPLKDLDGAFAKAYEAVDKKGGTEHIYALVFERNMPIRLSVINKLLSRQHEAICNVLAAEMIPVSKDNGRAFVAIVEKPKGIPLRKFIQEQGAVQEDILISRILTPLSKVLSFYAETDIVHGRINLDTVYLNQAAIGTQESYLRIKECISESSGFSQPVLFDPLDRAAALPAGKGEGDGSCDVYAVGVLGALLMLGKNPVDTFSEDDILQLKFGRGTYSLLSSKLKASPYMFDFLRGCICDKKKDIWMAVQFEEWIKGKKYNLLPPGSLVEATRPLVFNGREYLNRKRLAHDMYVFWEDAKKFVRGEDLVRWIERSLQNADLAELLNLVVSRSRYDTDKKNFDAQDELLMQVIMMLDPEGPLRIKHFSANLDGIGTMAAYAFASKKHEYLQTIADILANNVVGTWSTICPQVHSERYQQEIFALQKAAESVVKRHYGFGIERVLYELNPTLVCQSEPILEASVLTLEEALLEMENGKNLDENLLDRQAAAFLASRVELTTHIRIRSLANFPELASNTVLQNLALLSLVQKRSNQKKLGKLCNKIKDKLETVVKVFKSKTIRNEAMEGIKAASKQGNITNLLKVMSDVQYAARDKLGYTKAVRQYHELAVQIFRLSNKPAISTMGYRYGLQLSVMLSFLLASVVVLVLIIKIF